MEQQQPARLKDVLNYEAEEALTASDRAWLRATFKNNPRAISILRKLFLPTVTELPVEEMTNDVWFKGGVDWASIPAEHAHQLMIARQETIKWVMNGLVNLKVYANMPEETAPSKKDSNK